jgi:hypothetical protein
MTFSSAEASVHVTNKNAIKIPITTNDFLIFILLSQCFKPLNEEKMFACSQRTCAFVRSSSYLLSFGAAKNRNALGQDHPKASFKPKFGSPAVIGFWL